MSYLSKSEKLGEEGGREGKGNDSNARTNSTLTCTCTSALYCTPLYLLQRMGYDMYKNKVSIYLSIYLPEWGFFPLPSFLLSFSGKKLNK